LSGARAGETLVPEQAGEAEMRALVVYESMFGNTELVAQAVAAGLPTGWDVTTTEVGTAPAVIGPDVDLLLVGGPTHAFGMSREATRQNAESQAPDGIVSPGTGIREWLGMLGRNDRRTPFATFDTRLKKRGMPGSAARGAARRLRRLGLREATRPESFWVTDTRGPLVAWETERAHAWAETVAARAALPSPGART